MNEYVSYELQPQRETATLAENLDVLSTSRFNRDLSAEVGYATAAFPNSVHNKALPLADQPAVGIEAMYVEFFGEHQEVTTDSLIEAAEAGFNVEVHGDYYSDTILDQGFVWFPPGPFASQSLQTHRDEVSAYNHKRNDELEDVGVTMVKTNIPTTAPGKATYLLRDRNHKKIIYVKTPDRMVTWVGGMNSAEIHYRMLDFMVKIDDPRIVQPLVDEFQRDGYERREKSEIIQPTEDTQIIINALEDKDKVIERFIEEVDAEQEAVYVSSAFPPAGETLEALVRAKKRGVHVAWITTNPKVAGPILKVAGLLADAPRVLTGKQRIPLLHPKSLGVHAKALVCKSRGSVIIGSHNFVRAPHEELSLYSTNPQLVANVTKFLDGMTGGNLDRKIDADYIIPDEDIQV